MREEPKVPLLQAAISPSGMEAEVFFCLNNNIDSCEAGRGKVVRLTRIKSL